MPGTKLPTSLDLIEDFRARALTIARAGIPHTSQCPYTRTGMPCTCERAKVIKRIADLPSLSEATKQQFRELTTLFEANMDPHLRDWPKTDA